MGEEKKKWKVEKAAGGVVYKKHDSQIFVLLVNPKGPDFGPATGKWTFPKGLYDVEGEKKEDTAIREVREEGGVNALIKESLGYIKFFRTSKSFGNAMKFVDFWLMEYIDGNLEDHDNEIAESRWFHIDEVEKTLAWDHDKEVFNRAKKFLT